MAVICLTGAQKTPDSAIIAHNTMNFVLGRLCLYMVYGLNKDMDKRT
jgi:hypothetical protein